MIRSKGYDSSELYRSHAGHSFKQPVILKEDEIKQVIDELGIAHIED